MRKYRQVELTFPDTGVAISFIPLAFAVVNKILKIDGYSAKCKVTKLYSIVTEDYFTNIRNSRNLPSIA